MLDSPRKESTSLSGCFYLIITNTAYRCAKVDSLIPVLKRAFTVLKGAAGGAISGGIRTAMHNAIFGAQYQPLTDKNEPVSFPAKGAYRKGGIAGYMMHKLNRGGSGLTLGRNLFTVEKGEDYESIMDTRYHENIHLQQINHLGVARFYGTLFLQYMKYGFGKGPLEKDAYKNEDKWRNF